MLKRLLEWWSSRGAPEPLPAEAPPARPSQPRNTVAAPQHEALRSAEVARRAEPRPPSPAPAPLIQEGTRTIQLAHTTPPQLERLPARLCPSRWPVGALPSGDEWVAGHIRKKNVPPDRYKSEFRPEKLADAKEWAERKAFAQVNVKRFKARQPLRIPLGMLHDFLTPLGFVWIPSEWMVEEEGEQYLYAARYRQHVYKVYTGVEPGQDRTRPKDDDSLRATRVGLDDHLSDRNETAEGKPLTQRTTGWSVRLFNKIAELHGSPLRAKMPKREGNDEDEG